MQIRAAVAGGPSKRSFETRIIDIEEPRPDEILVRITGVGICHTDLACKTMFEGKGPCILGHEGAGTVEKVGSEVTCVVPGDNVVLTFRSCGRCRPCRADRPAYCVEFQGLNMAMRRPDGSTPIHDPELGPVGGNFFGQSSFADYAIAYERNIIKVSKALPIELLGPLGCGVQTGAGAVLRSLECRPGSSLVVTGGGAVGLSAVLAAKVAGCSTITVSEPIKHRRDLAEELGATNVVDSLAQPLAGALRGILPGGFDYALDTTGRCDVIGELIESMAPLGKVGFLGIPQELDATVPATFMKLMSLGLSLRGICEGDSDPKAFIPELLDLWQQGCFPFDKIIRTYRFDQIETAVDEHKAGGTVKAVLLT